MAGHCRCEKSVHQHSKRGRHTGLLRGLANQDPQHPPADVLRHLLETVLKLNTFEFDNKYYLQKFGTAMGSKLAPFMGKLEKTILTSSPLKPVYYRRFIDDIFMLWPHSEEELVRFIQHMNRANGSIQFAYEKSK